ncbi:MAG: cell division protein FtsA [Pseudomonadota bacterium]
MLKTEIFSILDIGTHQTKCLIAKLVADNALEIIGIGNAESEGIRAGIVTDIRQAEKSITKAVQDAEAMSGITIDDVAVSISGSKVRSHIVSIEENIKGREITGRDIKKILSEAMNSIDQNLYQVIHCIPINFILDDESDIKDPRGMHGSVLKTDIHLITTTVTSLLNVSNCLAHCHLNITDYIVTSYAAGIACLSDDEKDLGSSIIDIGAGHISIGVFKNGDIINTGSIPFGGNNLTKDIAWALSLDINEAEKIKIQYGNAVFNEQDRQQHLDKQIELDSKKNGKDIEISYQQLSDIIKPRLEEKIDSITKMLNLAHIDKMSSGRIILTGGGSQLANLNNFIIDSHKNLQVRIASPNMITGLADSLHNPSYAVAVGMLDLLLEKHIETQTDKKTDNVNYLAKMTSWLRNSLNI